MVAKIRRESYAYWYAWAAATASFGIALLFLMVGDEITKVLCAIFFLVYIVSVAIATNFKADIERDLLNYIKSLLDAKLIELESTEGLRLVRNKGLRYSYTIYANSYVTKEHIKTVMQECRRETRLTIDYVVVE